MFHHPLLISRNSAMAAAQNCVLQQNMNSSIRVAKPEDEKMVIDCVNDSYTKFISRIGKKPAPMLDNYQYKISKELVHVFEEKGKIVGIIVLVPRPDHLYLGNLAVSPDYQGKGIGRQLMLHAESVTKSHGLPEIRLFTNELMYENLAIYSKYGYLETDRKTENGYKRVYFSKKIL